MKKHHGPVLTDRQITITQNDVAGRLTWFSPAEYLKRRYASVVDAGLYECSSSAGDWGGYLIQKIGRTFYLILFQQENLCPRNAFSVTTDDKWALHGPSAEGVKDAFRRILPGLLSR